MKSSIRYAVRHALAPARIIPAIVFLAFMIVAPFALAQRTAGENLDDATLITRTKGALIDSDKVSADHINVEAYNGVVQLGGFVESKAEHDAAMAAARRIGAAREVIDAMVVLPGHRSLGQTIDDTAMQARLKVKLADIQGLGTAHKINTEVRQGHILLSGFVGHAEQRAEAGRLAASIDGAIKVHNMLALKP
jgi:hyperosmotically inducible protein